MLGAEPQRPAAKRKEHKSGHCDSIFANFLAVEQDLNAVNLFAVNRARGASPEDREPEWPAPPVVPALNPAEAPVAEAAAKDAAATEADVRPTATAAAAMVAAAVRAPAELSSSAALHSCSPPGTSPKGRASQPPLQRGANSGKPVVSKTAGDIVLDGKEAGDGVSDGRSPVPAAEHLQSGDQPKHVPAAPQQPQRGRTRGYAAATQLSAETNGVTANATLQQVTKAADGGGAPTQAKPTGSSKPQTGMCSLHAGSQHHVPANLKRFHESITAAAQKRYFFQALCCKRTV